MTAADSNTGPMITVRQVRSGIGFSRLQKATLQAMGLGRIGRRRQLPDNRAVRGMVARIPHLVVVEETDAKPGEDRP